MTEFQKKWGEFTVGDLVSLTRVVTGGEWEC